MRHYDEAEEPHPFELLGIDCQPFFVLSPVEDFGGRDWGRESAIVEPLVPGQPDSSPRPYQILPYKP